MTSGVFVGAFGPQLLIWKTDGWGRMAVRRLHVLRPAGHAWLITGGSCGDLAQCGSCVSTHWFRKVKSGCLPLTEGRVQLSRFLPHLGTHGERSPLSRFYPEVGRALPLMARHKESRRTISPSTFQGLHASSHLIDEHKSRVRDALMVPCAAHFECICWG